MKSRERAWLLPLATVAVVALALGHSAATAVPLRPGAVQAPSSATSTPRHVNRSELLDDVTTLASPRFEGRAAGSAGAIAARAWLLTRFAATGLRPAGLDGYTQPFTVSTRDFKAILPRGRPFRNDIAAANLVGRITGTDPALQTIVITAHYDHLGTRNDVVYPGADDNASGVAVLLAAARHFSGNRPRHPMIFVATDAEEMGLRGAQAFVGSALMPRGGVALNVNLDMVSRNATNEIFAAGTSHTPWLRPMVEDVLQRTPVTIRFGHDRAGDALEDWTDQSDHGAFHARGIPFVYFGVEDHPDYHEPTDTADRINPGFFGDVADMIVEAIRTFDSRLK